jgi:hypothetical protein
MPTETPTEDQATVTLPAGTIVRLMLIQPVNSANAKVGDELVGDLVVIPRKSTASGTVTELQPPRCKKNPGALQSRQKACNSSTTRRWPGAVCGP